MVQLHDKRFVPYLSAEEIQSLVRGLARRIDADYAGRNPLCLAILNGAFIFAADLFRALEIPAEISFVKLASYAGTGSTGKVTTAIGLEEDLSGRDILILEDIVDTGTTLHSFLPSLKEHNPASVAIASLLDKPSARQAPIAPDYAALQIPDLFVVGYGLDYNGLGRGLPDIYQLRPGD